MRFSETEKKTTDHFRSSGLWDHICPGPADVVWKQHRRRPERLSQCPDALSGAGVMLAYLLTRRGDRNVPRIFYVTFLVITVLMILCALASVFMPQSIQAGPDGNVGMDDTGQVVLILGSIVFWITPSGVRKRKKGSLGTSVEELEKIDFMYAFVLWALQSRMEFPMPWEDR